MKGIVTSVVLLTLAMTAGCAEQEGLGGEEAVLENESAVIGQNLVLRPGTFSNCGQQENPVLQFFGTSPGNREAYTVQNLNMDFVSLNGCQITVPLTVPAGFKARVKSATMVGNAFPVGIGTQGRVEVRADLRTRSGGVVSTHVPVPPGSPVPGKNVFKNVQFTTSQFTQCLNSPLPNLETLFVNVQSFVDLGTSIPGQQPNISASLRPIEVSLEVAPCP